MKSGLLDYTTLTVGISLLHKRNGNTMKAKKRPRAERIQVGKPSASAFSWWSLFLIEWSSLPVFGLTQWSLYGNEFTTQSKPTELRAIQSPVRNDDVSPGKKKEILLDFPDSPSSRTGEHVNSEDFSPQNRIGLPPCCLPYDHFTAEEIEVEVGWLQYSLLDHGVSFDDVRQIVSTIYNVSENNTSVTVGIVQFLRLLFDTCGEEAHMDRMLSTSVVLASVYHYAECMEAHNQGSTAYLLGNANLRNKEMPHNRASIDSEGTVLPAIRGEDTLTRDIVSPRPMPRRLRSSTGSFGAGDEVFLIAEGAARIKRAEALVQSVIGNGHIISQAESDLFRDWLLSVMDDWRSLAIRVFACLYRLEGIRLDAGTYDGRTPEVVKLAKEAMRVYSPLAGRLGMYRLKSRLDEEAFRILYRRQYNAVSSLYLESGAAMEAVSNILRTKISVALQQDESLMMQLEGLEVSSRVKQPYSFWKKLLKKRTGGLSIVDRRAITNDSTLSIAQVQDGIALRVIIQAKKWTENEPLEEIRARERFFCYYVQHQIRMKWPEVEADRVKDYILYPKPNGYRSLHHTSSVNCNGVDFPFEVQVRSEEMHMIAEYGVAAHWGYKLGNILAPSSPSVGACAGMLPPAKQCCEILSPAFRPGFSFSHTRLGSTQSFADALVDAKETLLEQYVYVFISGISDESDGQLLSLPAKSLVVDALAAMDKIDASNLRVLLNGKRVKLDDVVENGDVLMVVA
jgi:ppGpp synthetase/RelA/SpoT-type nucleotidyltranferase